MIDLDYGFRHIELVWRMVRGDEEALDEMDISADGFWRSFGAIVFCLPAMFFGWVYDANEAIATGLESKSGAYIFKLIMLEAMLWFLPILLLAFVLRPLGLAHRFTHLIIVRNWFSVPIYYLYAILTLPAFFIAGFETPLFLNLVVLGVTTWLLIRLTRQSLACENSFAIPLVIAEFVISIFVLMFLQQSLGLLPPMETVQ